ncbi:glycosyltransferase family 4 protein [Candidatus Endowatersipora endosymbiont of Watersipora subatra]|uniref:glycosyltransferase family 4 protein n=1 Tax=Candidatus Endowatersipora endosymbiont of Watersipora subatra TaxID=3077946 RepID=UPI00312C7D13
MNEPTILQIVPALKTGGVEQTALDVGHAVSKEGWRSLIASSGGRMCKEAEQLGSEHIILPLDTKNPIALLRNTDLLKSVIRSYHVDLLHARSRAPAWSSLFAARQTNTPFVTTYHGAYTQKSWPKKFYNSVMVRGDMVIANSQWTANLIYKRHPSASQKIVAIARGIDFSKFDLSVISEERLMALRQNWNIRESDIIFLNLARLTHWKGQSVIIEAARQVISSYPCARFILAGDPQGRTDYVDRLQKKITEYDLKNHFVLPGHCNDPSAAIALADIIVVASIKAETFGRTAVEAAAMGKPVLATRIGAVEETVCSEPECIHDQNTGWKVKAGNSEEMAIAMNHILSLSMNTLQEIGTRARNHVHKFYSVERMREKTIAVYRSLLTKRK